MLRRKLLTRIGLLICAFVIGAVAAVWSLQSELAQIQRVNADAAFLIDGIQAVAAAANQVQTPRSSPDAAPDRALLESIEQLGRHPATLPGGVAAEEYARLRDDAPVFIAAWAPSRHDPAASPDAAAFTAGVRMQTYIQELGRTLRAHVARQQLAIGHNFRTLVLVLTLAALVMVNVAIFVLLRTAQLVLKPVGALVDGSRELAAEHFDHRVVLDQKDEFGELARAYNHLAEQLQSNEEHKAEALRHLAVTLNHALNNAMSIIELQLGLLDRQAGGNPTLARHLHEIRASLTRMSQIVASLKNIRRVVLTDYGPGQKMVDLERSVEAGEQQAAQKLTSV